MKSTDQFQSLSPIKVLSGATLARTPPSFPSTQNEFISPVDNSNIFSPFYSEIHNIYNYQLFTWHDEKLVCSRIGKCHLVSVTYTFIAGKSRLLNLRLLKVILKREKVSLKIN